MKNFLIGILIAAIIIGTGFGVKWEVDSFNAKYNTPIEDQLKEVEDETTTDETKELDLEKCLNNNDYTYELTSNPMTDEEINKMGININYNENEKKYSLNVNWNKANEYFGLTLFKTSGTEDYALSNLDGSNVKLYKIVSTYQGVGEEAIIFVMEDGTVEYIPVEKALTTGNIKSYGTLQNITNAISLNYVEASPKNEEAGSNYVTTIVQTQDGSFYDLRVELVNKLY